MNGARGAGLLSALAGLAAAWIAFDLLVWGYGESPRHLFALLFQGTWGSPYGAGQVLFKATPLLLTGIAVDLALRAGLYNIGAEGQVAVLIISSDLAELRAVCDRILVLASGRIVADLPPTSSDQEIGRMMLAVGGV